MDPTDLKMVALSAMGMDATEIDADVQQVETKGTCTFYQFATVNRWPERQITVVECGDSSIAIDSVGALEEVIKRCPLKIDNINDFVPFFGAFLCPPSKRLVIQNRDLPDKCTPHLSGEAAVLYWWDVGSDVYEEVTITPNGLETKIIAMGTTTRYRLEVDPEMEDE